MLQGQAIDQLVALLERRRVSFFHACQYVDFCTYLSLGGIPSRALLELERQKFTVFETDVHDRHNGVWDKVFINLSDFGELFAKGLCAVPNPYGPIVIQLKPTALLETRDLAVCLRSAGAADFDRTQEALCHVSEIDYLFLNEPDAEFPSSTFLKPAEHLRALRPAAKTPEVSCSVERGFIPLSYTIAIWTDPYFVGGHSLRNWVKLAMDKAGVSFKLWDRACREDRKSIYGELLGLLMVSTPSLNELLHSTSHSSALHDWALELKKRELGYQFQRYARYFVDGTIHPLIN